MLNQFIMKGITLFFILLSGVCLNAQTPELVIPKGHTGNLTSSACTSDGKYVLTGGRDLRAKLWDSKGNEIITYPSENEVQAVAVSNDSKNVLIGSADNKVQLLKLTGEKVIEKTDHKKFVNAVAFSPRNDYFATASDDGSAILYDMNGNKIKILPHKKPVRSVCFDSRGKLILTAGGDKTAVLWDLNAQKIMTFTGHTATINQARMSVDGNYVLTCSDDKNAILWNKNGTPKVKISHVDKVTACDISSDNSVIVTGCYNGQIKIWNLKGQVSKDLGSKAWGLSSVTILPDGKSFIVTSADFIRQYDLNGNIIRHFEGKTKSVTAVCFSNDGKSILQGDNAGQLKLWDANNNSFINDQPHTTEIACLAWRSDSAYRLSGSEDKTAVLSSPDGKWRRTLQLDSKVTAVGFSPDGKSLLTGCYDGNTVIWNRDGSKKYMIPQTGEQISAAAFSSDGKLIVTSSYTGNVAIFSGEGKPVKKFSAQSQVNAMVISADSKSIITGSFSGLAQIWDINTSEPVTQFGVARGDEILSVAASANNQYVAAGSNAGYIRILNNNTHQETVIKAHQTRVNALSFAPDNRTLSSASTDGTVKIWDCASGKELAELIALDHSDWVVTTPTGLFDASPAAMLKLKYRVGLELIDIDQLKERYYEPGLLRSIFKIEKTELRDVTAFNSVALYPLIEAKITGDQMDIRLTPRSGELGKLSIFVNEKEVIQDANPERRTEIKGLSLTQFNSYFTSDSNKIVLRTFNKDSWLKSPPYEIYYKPFEASRGTERPQDQANNKGPFKGQRHLYAIIVGTSDYSGDKMDLIYPDKDANAFASALKQVATKLYKENVHITVLTTSPTEGQQRSTRKNIEKAFQEMYQKVTAEDIMLVYLSGHGTNYGEADKSQFYYLTTDINSENLEQKDIRDAYTISSDELTQWLKENHSRRQVVIIDACHSGDVAKSLGNIGARDLTPSQVKAFERMKDRTGIFVLTGSASDKVSYESSQYGQGLLTYSLLQGMSGGVNFDLNIVDVGTLFTYASNRVPELAEYIKKIQKPVFGAPLGVPGISIGLNDSVNIKLLQPKPIFIQSTFLNSDQGMDNIGVAGAMKKHLQELALDPVDAPVVYVDVDTYPDAYQMSGTYKINGGKISIAINLIKNKEKLVSIAQEGDSGNLREFVEAAFDKVFAEVKK